MGIFPPSGVQDQERGRRIASEAERDYLWFCLEFCGMVLERRPRHFEAMAAAAGHFTTLGFFADGLALDRRLAALFPNDPGILYNLACSLALTGKREEAILGLTLAVAKGYADCDNLLKDQDLASIRRDPRFKIIFARAAAKKI
ncbi:MAG: hypothetical protein LBU23_12800 [Planctomycetota bacterium]|jgi:hypothetical protein|nr:hypothetical protein [Planctomycetota bacterium]